MTEAIERATLVASAEKLSRANRARSLHAELLELRDAFVEKWARLGQLLYPIHEERLYRELGFETWTQYVRETLALPVQSANNFLLPYRRLLEAGIDPASVSDISRSNALDLADITQARGGKLDPELLEAARTHTHEEVHEFKDRIRAEKQVLGIEELRTIKLAVQESTYNLFWEMARVVAHQGGLPAPEKRHEVELLERSLVAFLQLDESQATIVEMGDR